MILSELSQRVKNGNPEDFPGIIIKKRMFKDYKYEYQPSS